MGRPKGQKNKKSIAIKSKGYYFRLEEDLQAFLDSMPCKSSYITGLIRKDFNLKKEEGLL